MSRIFLVLITIIFSGTAFAADTPLPAKKTGTLGQLQEQMAERKQEKSRLEKEIRETDKELQKIKSDLVNAAKDVKNNETRLRDLTERKSRLEEEETAIKSALQNDYGSLAALILALERMRRVPPELLIVRPGAPLETAQTATLMRNILPSLTSRTQELSAQLIRLSEIQDTLTKDREDTIATKQTLQKNYQRISGLAQKREQVYRSLNKDFSETQKDIERIARETKSMQELLDRIHEQQEQEKANNNNPKRQKAVAWSMPQPGKPQLPVSGIEEIGYGKKDSIGAISKGITLRAAPSALVVAPIGGIIRFSGNFLHYGLMVIIEHEKGYHSLIAGFESINSGVGQSISAGEPIGKLPAASSRDNNPALYYELRYKGRPVDPAKAFSDIKS